MLLARVTVVAPFLPVTAHVAFFAVGTVKRNFGAAEVGADVAAGAEVAAVVAGVAFVVFLTLRAMTDFKVAAFFTPVTFSVGTRDACPTEDLITIAFAPSTSNGMSCRNAGTIRESVCVPSPEIPASSPVPVSTITFDV